jgi:hypothetical protein
MDSTPLPPVNRSHIVYIADYKLIYVQSPYCPHRCRSYSPWFNAESNVESSEKLQRSLDEKNGAYISDPLRMQELSMMARSEETRTYIRPVVE